MGKNPCIGDGIRAGGASDRLLVHHDRPFNTTEIHDTLYLSHAAFLLVQHADRDTAFQKKCLPLLQKAAEEGEASKSDMAYLTDRIRVADGQKQLYGTQCSWKDTLVEMDPIEDSLHVDERRAEVGLEPLDVYMRATKFALRHGSSVGSMMNPGSPAYDSLKEIYGPYFKDEDSLEK